MNTRTWVSIGLAALCAAAGGCKSKTTSQVTSAQVAPLATVAATPKPAAEAPFEGEIQLAVYEPSSKTPQTIAYDVKGDDVRAQPVTHDTSVAWATGSRKDRKMLAVSDSGKSYSNIDLNTKTPLPAVTKTGKIEHVMGHECEDWTMTSGGEHFDMCVAKGIAYLDPSVSSGEPIWAAVLTGEDAFPLRVIATDKTGKQEFRAEATKIETRTLDAALFKVPTTYKSVPAAKSLKVASIP